MAERGRAECEYAKEIQDYPFFPSFSLISSSRRATKDLDEAKSDDSSVEIISKLEFLRWEKGNEEVESCLSAFQYVDGQRVKAEFAPVLREIFYEYGNIARGNEVKSPVLLSSLLERICHIYRRVEQGKSVDLKRTELQGFLSELRVFERRKLRVGWIVERVEKYISSAEAEAKAKTTLRRRSARPKSMPKKLKGYACAAVRKQKRGGKKN